jgi:hypothetical protein
MHKKTYAINDLQHELFLGLLESWDKDKSLTKRSFP